MFDILPYKSTLKKLSCNGNGNRSLLQDENKTVFNFDAYTKLICNKMRDKQTIASCDAYYETKDGMNLFLEFKDSPEGNVDAKEVREKAYNSMSTLLMWKAKGDIEDLKNRTVLFVLYNNEKREQVGKKPTSYNTSKSFDAIAKKIASLAELEDSEYPIKFGLSKYRTVLYKKIYTIDITMFKSKFFDKIFTY